MDFELSSWTDISKKVVGLGTPYVLLLLSLSQKLYININIIIII